MLGISHMRQSPDCSTFLLEANHDRKLPSLTSCMHREGTRVIWKPGICRRPHDKAGHDRLCWLMSTCQGKSPICFHPRCPCDMLTYRGDAVVTTIHLTIEMAKPSRLLAGRPQMSPKQAGPHCRRILMTDSLMSLSRLSRLRSNSIRHVRCPWRVATISQWHRPA